MRKNKLNILIAILTSIILLSTAAICTQIGTRSETPTIKLEIYEGPTYSAADDVCYYRIEAKVTGNPVPTVKFSKDDSNGAFGSKKVQVNITQGESYTLTATATNSEGDATDSFNLIWGCNGEVASEFTEDEITIDASVAESGYKIDGGLDYFGENWIFFGDEETDKRMSGYLVFSIEDLKNLADITIIKAAVEISSVTFGNEPWLVPDKMEIVIREGDNTYLVYTLIPSDSITDISFSSWTLNEGLQNTIDKGLETVLFIFYMDKQSNNGIDDWYAFRPSNASLKVKYRSLTNAM